MGAADGGNSCPECGEPLPEEARFCPHCVSDLADDGSAVDRSELEGAFDVEGLTGADVEEGLASVGGPGRRRASGRVRALAGLAVAVPLAPIVLFLASSVLSLTPPTALLVLLAGWLCPAAYLSRARMPAAAFGRSLHLVAIGTALVPVAIHLRPEALADGPLTPAFGTVTLAAAVVAGLCLLLGAFVRRQVDRRPDGDRRFVEGAE